MSDLTCLAKQIASHFDLALDGSEALVEWAERPSIALWGVKLPMHAAARCCKLDPEGHFVSLAVPEHFVSRPDPVERTIWKFSNERRAMSGLKTWAECSKRTR